MGNREWCVLAFLSVNTRASLEELESSCELQQQAGLSILLPKSLECSIYIRL